MALLEALRASKGCEMRFDHKQRLLERRIVKKAAGLSIHDRAVVFRVRGSQKPERRPIGKGFLVVVGNEWILENVPRTVRGPAETVGNTP